ncbi:DUF502 domain-containing protein [Phycisphaerales bacterium AB-hyl4]|uniref:DUF502 domain-containing protein n=1 Tax=Natronomicrosphaera hydrolytica TaxID=3242702 RepID=A0ABV4U6P3_9BACT
MLRILTRIFLKGLVALLPIVLTLYLVGLLGWWAETTMRSLLTVIIAEERYLPGMGLVLAVAVILLAGLLIDAYLFRRTLDYTEQGMQRVPVVKSVYGAIKDFMGYFSTMNRQRMNQVVLVRLPNSDFKILGLVTREQFRDLPKGVGGDGAVAVYFPMSYQIGGYTVILPREQIEPVDMSIEDGLRFALTAGIKSDQSNGTESAGTPVSPGPDNVTNRPGSGGR